MIDLHTNCSDGSDDPIELLKKVEAVGITHFSITDHNNVDAYFKIEEAGGADKFFNGKFIKGIEPEGMYRGRLIELIGYNIDIVKMHELLKGVYKPKNEMLQIEYKGFYNACVKAGIKFSPGIFECWDRGKHYYGGCHLHADLIKYPENKKIITDEASWGSGIQFFRNYGNNPLSPLNVDISEHYPKIETVSNLIKQAGGLVFIPHIFAYGKDSIPFLEGLVSELQIDGIECYYPTFTKEQTEFLLDFCKRHNLLISGGSDYHGSQRPNPLGSGIPMQQWFGRVN